MRKEDVFAYIAAVALISIFFTLISSALKEKEPEKPIESSRTVVMSCTVKSNIEGVITLNDDCKITVIGEN